MDISVDEIRLMVTGDDIEGFFDYLNVKNDNVLSIFADGEYFYYTSYKTTIEEALKEIKELREEYDNDI